MSEEFRVKLLSKPTLIISGCAVLAMAILTQIAQTTLVLTQLIPCFLFLGQPEIPDSLRKKIKDGEMEQ